MKCKCGEAIVCPNEPEGELYELARAVTRVVTDAKPQAARAPVVAYRAPGIEQAGEKKPLSDRAINVEIPLVILCGGLLVEIAGALLEGQSMRHAIGTLIVRLTLAPAVMMFGIFIAAKFREIDFGDFATAALKVAAICIGSSAAATLLLPLGHVLGLIGALVGLGVQFVLYFALLGMMFNLDESDTWYCVMVFFVIDVALYFGMQYAMTFG